MRPVLSVRLAALGAALVLLPSAARAQDGAVLEVRVLDAATRQPLPGAQVVLTGWRRAAADRAGVVRLTGVPRGTQTVEAVMLGYASRAVIVDVPVSGTVARTLELSARPIELAGVSAQARPVRRSPRLEAFYRRSRTGVGVYFTRQQIETLNPASLTDIFRNVPGLVMVHTPIGDKPRVIGVTPELLSDVTHDNGDCPILYFIDGVPYEPSHRGIIALDLSPAEVEGIEIYKRGSAVPVQYKRANDACGVILIWKRERA
ncbi:MAG TPA: carboxypeptidase regulatory-like domain-containing protein [Longimicrobium sp.]|nr:carboxypeptidase regulatory-like domain-containing protein [Longimicrobium sp.]